jgi:hypothetical protein
VNTPAGVGVGVCGEAASTAKSSTVAAAVVAQACEVAAIPSKALSGMKVPTAPKAFQATPSSEQKALTIWPWRFRRTHWGLGKARPFRAFK